MSCDKNCAECIYADCIRDEQQDERDRNKARYPAEKEHRALYSKEWYQRNKESRKIYQHEYWKRKQQIKI